MGELQALLSQKESLTEQLRQNESGDEKILAAIKAQRWFFFENNDKILFDSRNALIWANLNLFPWWHKTSISALYANCRIDHYLMNFGI